MSEHGNRKAQVHQVKNMGARPGGRAVTHCRL